MLVASTRSKFLPGLARVLSFSGLSSAARIAVACAAAFSCMAGLPPVAWARPVSTDRAVASRTIRVTSLNNSGHGTLRWALQQANATARISTRIDFGVAGLITLTSPLPTISADVTIDGQSGPGYAAGRAPVVGIDFAGRAGLSFAPGSAGSQLLGMAVDDAGGNGVTLDAGSITLNADYIGVGRNGSAVGNRGDGVYVSARSSGDRIGLNPSGHPGVIGNVISGNSGSGIVLSGSSRDTVVANRIGTDAAGTSAMANRGDGILITGHADASEIGGTDFTDPATGQANNPTGSKGTVPPVFVVPPLGNLISGNGRNGVEISDGARDNKLNGNFIGTSANGDSAVGNAGNGVWIDHAGGNSLVGCKFVNNPFVYYNVVSGNGKNGLRVTSSNNVTVQGNFFGVGANNTAVVGNRLNGILVDGSSARTQVGGVIPLGNVSAGNGVNGIEVANRAHGFVTFNTFGGLLAFKGAAPNGNDGLLVTSSGGDNLARTNVFSGNRGNGIELAGEASGVTVVPNIVGLSTNGRSALPNGGDGLLIDGNAAGNVIGGSLRSVIPQDTFSGNRGYGIVLAGRAHGNRVFTSFIGTAIFGLERIANGKGGVLLTGRAYGNTIGGTKIPANLISGNVGAGVALGPLTTRNRVIGNYIGLDRLGRRLPNTGPPVVNHGRHNVIRANRSRPVKRGH
jgi:parallel beta-helix repeat protein